MLGSYDRYLYGMALPQGKAVPAIFHYSFPFYNILGEKARIITSAALPSALYKIRTIRKLATVVLTNNRYHNMKVGFQNPFLFLKFRSGFKDIHLRLV